MAALKYWVWLTTLPGLTDHSKLLLLQHFPLRRTYTTRTRKPCGRWRG